MPTYLEKLQSEEWFDKRKEILERDNYTCKDCGEVDIARTWSNNAYESVNYDPYSGLYRVIDHEIGREFQIPLEPFSIALPVLNIHHKRYILNRNPWEYDNVDLITLCSECHTKRHESEKILLYNEHGNIIKELIKCDRCNGSGSLPQYHYVQNGICFKCWGAGIDLNYIELIEKKRESDYWDFKEKPHENNASLLHDIICLANSLYKGDKYLIVGVSDPSSDCTVIGLTKGQVNRKNQANLIDFLRTKSFAGDIRPEIELKTVKIQKKEIDVIVIFDRPLKPYYLTEDFRDKDKLVRANNIYSRILDTNTPIDKSADLYNVEKMWFQRFGFDLSPSERFKVLLSRPDEWFKDIGNVDYCYHKTFPEFRIELTEPRDMWEPFCEFYPNNKGYFGKAIFKYQLNTLFELVYIYCDEMRIVLANPKSKYVRINGEENWFYYYNLNDWDGIFLKFLTSTMFNFGSRGSGAPFLIFENENEIAEFKEYLENNPEEIESVQADYVPKPKNKEYNSVVSLEFLCKAKILYDKKSFM